jgi:hypothetical protein
MHAFMRHSARAESWIAKYLNFGEVRQNEKQEIVTRQKWMGADNLLNVFKRGGFCVRRCEILSLTLNFKHGLKVLWGVYSDHKMEKVSGDRMHYALWRTSSFLLHLK